MMTGFKRNRRSSDKKTHGMLTSRIVVDTPVRSKTDKVKEQIVPGCPFTSEDAKRAEFFGERIVCEV